MLEGLKKIFTRQDADWERYRQIADKKAMFTPDLDELQMLQAVNIFVYNEMQEGMPKHGILGPKKMYGGMGYTESPDFVMYKKLLGKETFPFALPITEEQRHGMSSLIGDPGQIMGEIYTVKPYQMVELDNYMLNTVLYFRVRVPILIPFMLDPKSDKFEIKAIEAYMWIGLPEFWLDQIASEDAKRLFSRSHRLFNVKNNKEEPLSAYYVFDWNVEAHRE